MQKPTYQQISELYHELWELQQKLDDAESERDLYMKSRAQESEYANYLLNIILNARAAFNNGDYAELSKELNKV